MIRQVSSRVSFPDLEKDVLSFWKEKDIFRRTERDRDDKPLFMLYEGPPTANGSPGIHHVLARVFKDIICRYKTMKGYRCLRKGGWDTHGLPVELEVERELGLHSKREIEEYGIERFNQKCRESVFRYVKEWEEMTDRIAYWVDMEDPYVTLENSYIETGWWVLGQLWEKGLLYQDIKGTPHCPRCVTSLSSHEVALGYQEDTPDPSVYIKFRLTGFNNTIRTRAAFDGAFDKLIGHEGIPVYLLAWTTTPWTLPGNTALAVDAMADYSLVEVDSPEGGEKQRLILATPLLGTALGAEYKVLDSFPGPGAGRADLRAPIQPFRFRPAQGRCQVLCVGGAGGPARGLPGNHPTNRRVRELLAGARCVLRLDGGRHRHSPHRPSLRRRGPGCGQGARPGFRPIGGPPGHGPWQLLLRRQVR